MLQLKGLTENEYTCFEEMRARPGTDYTFAEFRVSAGGEEKYVIDMDFTGIEQQDIETYCDDILLKQAQTAVDILIKTGMDPSKELLKAISGYGTLELAIGYVGMSFLRPICQEIFIPIDDDKCTNGEEREKAYKSFHVLAEYLEKKNIAGVIYPSTRTALNGIHSQNLVAFNVEDFSVVSGSLRTIKYRNII